MKKLETLKFKHFCMSVGNLPSSYVESLSYYECLLWLIKFLQEEVIPTVNNNSEVVEELQNTFIALKTYVENYFENLDVQEEINNKLDEMVEEGTLQEIISAYLNSKAIFGFDTVEDMKEASNLISGSYARTIGYYEKEDKGGNLYYISDTDTEDIRSIELNDGLFAIAVIDSKIIKGKKLGLHADKITDDLLILQSIINFCKENDYILELDGYSYVSDTIDTKGVKIIGNGIPDNAPSKYISKTYGDIGFDYLRNTGNGALITFNDYADDVLIKGSGIISDVANPILKCKHSDGKFNLSNITICGWLRNNQQEGLLSIYENTDTHINGKHIFDNVYVINCGNNAVHLQSLETTVVNKLNCNYNFGYGLYIEGISGFDTPFEYVDFNDCHFNGNKLGGVYAHNCFRKQVRFNRCQANSSGLYNQLEISVPSNTDNIIFGFKIDGKESSSNAARKILEFNNCYAEECNKLIEIISNTSDSSYILNDITVKNCVSYPYGEASEYNCLLNLKTYYTEYFSYYNNFFNGSNGLKISSTKHLSPLIVDKNFYTSYDNVKTLNVNEAITTATVSVKRFGNIVKLQVEGNANSNITAYSNLLSNFPTPIDNQKFIILVDNVPYTCGLYTSNQCTTGATINSGQHVLIELMYFVDLKLDK